MNRKETFWDKLIDTLQIFSLAFVLFLVFVCVLTLILFDVLVGAGIMLFLTNNQLEASVFISLATSGLLVSLMVAGYMMTSPKEGKKNKAQLIGGVFLVLAALVFFLDVYFDSLTADFLRYGEIISLKEIQDPTTHMLFRVLIGGISTIGESLAMAIIVGMPVLKEIINKALPEDFKNKHQESHNKSKFVYSNHRNSSRDYEFLD